MKLPQIGPAFLVTAAFIGPGTVITASLAGANFGFTLIWALVFAVFASIILQEMAARLGIVTQQGLGENIRSSLSHPVIKWLAVILIGSAIVIGNGAYQSGNISGAALGLSSLFSAPLIEGVANSQIWPLLIGSIAFILLWVGSYKLIEKSLILLVGIMSASFLITLVLVQPNIKLLVTGMFIPSIPSGATLTVIALIGTTVVPYNLFLHAAIAKEKWKNVEDIKQARTDLFISIPLGGLISIAIVSTAAAAFFEKQMVIHSAADLAPALEPLFGKTASLFTAFGLFAAGISSAITAPLAAAYALSGILNFSAKINSVKFKIVWMAILLIGIVVSSMGYKPISIIWFAQVTNGILLPIICVFLLWTMNTKKLGAYRNNHMQNILGVIVLMVTLLLSGKSLMSAFGFL